MNYEDTNYQIKKVELRYDGVYNNLSQYNLSLKTQTEDEVNIKIFLEGHDLQGYYTFSEIIKKNIFNNESSIKIKNHPSIEFEEVSEFTLKISKETQYLEFNLVGWDKNIKPISIIYKGSFSFINDPF
jgi:hypothetical protein